MKSVADVYKAFNAMDIVGAKYGECCVVDKYIGQKDFYYANSKKPQKIHMYKVRCEICGNVIEKKRDDIIKSSRKTGVQCGYCVKRKVAQTCLNTDEIHHLAIEEWRNNDAANSNNISTGIKHYSVSKRVRRYKDSEYVRYIHSVVCIIDGITYKIAFKEQKECEIMLFAEIANELNEILKNGGKEAFYEWYESKIN